MQQHHSILQKLHDELQIIRAPVRRIPPEILQEIFLAMVGEFGFEVVREDDPYYVVGRVCQTWRTTSLCCPQIWCDFNLYGATGYPAHEAERHLRSMLGRTRGLPINFTLPFHSDSPEHSISEHKTLRVLLGVLGQYSMQWSSVRFLGLPMSGTRVLCAVRERLPLLKSLQLHIGDLDEEDSSEEDSEGSEEEEEETEDTTVLRAFEVAPNLSHVLLLNAPLGQVALPPSLESLTIHSVDYFHQEINIQAYSRATPPLHHVLTHFPKLCTVVLHRRYFRTSENTARPPLSLPQRTVHNHLVSLQTSDFIYFYHVSLPSLEKLHVGPQYPHHEEPLNDFLPAVSSLLRHSRCPLSRLTLQNGAWTADTLCNVLSLARQVEDLHIVYFWHPDEIVLPMLNTLTDALLEVASSECNREGDMLRCIPTFLPALKTLKITTLCWTFVNKAFVEMTARRWCKDGLRAVQLNCQKDAEMHSEVLSELDECDWERLRAMKKLGLDITWGNVCGKP